MKFNIVVCGGTFDHFHKGHKSFLMYVFSFGKKIIVGVTSDEYVKSSKFPSSVGRQFQSSKLIEDFKKRKQEILDFIKEKKVLDRVEVVKINDLFGPTLDKKLAIDAIVVSEDTKKGADIINQKRRELGLNQFKVLIAPKVNADDGGIISSQRIRDGQINRNGKPYISSIWLKKDLMLPENLREEFQKPFGELLTSDKDLSENKNNLVITVGDITSKIFNEKSLRQNISVLDLKVAREKKFSNIFDLGFTGQEKVFNVDNPAGFITSNLFKKISEIFNTGIENEIILQVNGEEDLCVLPLVLLAPLGSIIFYGQPNQGMVKVVVSEEVKNRMYELADRF